MENNERGSARESEDDEERKKTMNKIEKLIFERDEARNKLSQENKKNHNPFSYETINDDDKKCLLLTGLNKEVLNCLIGYLKQCNVLTKKASCPVEDQILLVIVRLKHNMTFEILSHICSIGKTTVIDYFWKWIDIMYENLKFLVKMQDRENIFKTIPTVFKAKFPKLTSIIDCFEIFIESPRNLLARAQCYSQYKKHCTIKVFISCTPLGAVNFISRCWGGRASDIQIVRESGFTSSKYHYPGDQILADRGFTLEEDFALDSQSQLFIPAFTKGKAQLSAVEVEATRKIASVRIHIERVIGLIKNRYSILKGILPLRTVKSIKDESLNAELANCDKIILVCAALSNLNESIVYRESSKNS